MKTINIIYWVTTVLFAAFMISTAIPNIIMNEDSIKFIGDLLGYPKYLIPFLGWAKVFGSIGILLPVNWRIKEWAYAGLFFDLTGAMYSVVSVSGFDPGMAFMILPYGLMAASYIFNLKRSKAKVAGYQAATL